MTEPQVQIPENVMDDFKKLIEFLVPFAQKMLQEKGNFFPFGASINNEGNSQADGVFDNNEQSQNLINDLTKVYQSRQKEGALRASGICIDCRVIDPRDAAKKKKDAILVQLEHVSGKALNYYLPYEKDLLRKVKYGSPFASPTKPVIFIP